MNNFERTIKFLSNELMQNLPGVSAQELMAPPGRKLAIEYLKENIIPKKSAVLILIYPDDDSVPRTVLMLRPEKEKGIHAGQISFPGGRYDDTDGNLFRTALRETEEEIGINRNLIQLLGKLTPLYIPVSNYMVYPFVGFIEKKPVFKIHPEEVKELLEVCIFDFLMNQNIGTASKYIKVKEQIMEVPCYNLNGKIIWGATAMIIAELSEILKKMQLISF